MFTKAYLSLHVNVKMANFQNNGIPILSNQGPDPLSSDQPARTPKTPEEQKQMVLKAYRELKKTFAEYEKPDGDKETPAKTCRDLHVAHPEKPSGEVFDLYK